MPKGTKQKQKLYILGQIMLERTDDTHYLTLSEIKNLLEKEGVTADRKTLYDDLAVFSKMSFGMYGGKHEKIILQFKEEMVGALIDRFGKDIPILRTNQPKWYETVVDVMVSPQFFGWLYALSPDVRLVGPKQVVIEWKKRLEETNELY